MSSNDPSGRRQCVTLTWRSSYSDAVSPTSHCPTLLTLGLRPSNPTGMQWITAELWSVQISSHSSVVFWSVKFPWRLSWSVFINPMFPPRVGRATVRGFSWLHLITKSTEDTIMLGDQIYIFIYFEELQKGIGKAGILECTASRLYRTGLFFSLIWRFTWTKDTTLPNLTSTSEKQWQIKLPHCTEATECPQRVGLLP